jgi:hypothetical protein
MRDLGRLDEARLYLERAADVTRRLDGPHSSLAGYIDGVLSELPGGRPTWTTA